MSWIALIIMASFELNAKLLAASVIGSYALTFLAVPFVRCTSCRCLVALRFISPRKQLRLIIGKTIPCPKCGKQIS